jgi:hypothetical protein
MGDRLASASLSQTQMWPQAILRQELSLSRGHVLLMQIVRPIAARRIKTSAEHFFH